jgi:type I restriction enzyme M protein
LGHKWTNVGGVYQKSSKIHLNQNLEILFIERCLQLLKNGGRMGIVLPNGNFENPSLEYLREYIKRNANILAVINLPTETFIPFGTGVKTSLLFIQKGGKTTNSIFFGRVTKLGYQGNKNGTPIYKKDDYGNTLSDENDEPVLDEDFSLIIKQYNDFKKGSLNETSNSFSLDYAQLNGRFDFDFYSPENRKMFKQLEGLKTVRLGDICEIIKTKSKKLKNSKLSVEYVELSDVNTHSYEIINSTTYLVHELPSRATFELNDGDIITAIAGNSVGTRKHATALVNEDFQGSICTNGFRVLRNFKIDIHYLLFFLKSEYFLKQMFMYRTGAAIPNVSDIDLANMLITIPDKKIIKSISSKMKRAFDLRIESRKEIDSINLNQPGLKIFSNHDIP